MVGRVDGAELVTPINVDLARYGVYSFETFQKVVATEPQWVVRGLVPEKSVNLLIGNSGLGKTPLGITLGISVAAGVPFFGHPVQKGPVLYCDAESTKHDFNRIVENVSKTLGLAKPPPDFMFWSPYWSEEPSELGPAGELLRLVTLIKPRLVFVDTLRTFWPHADQKSEVAVGMFKAMRSTSAAWVITHHRRKEQQGGMFTGDLVQDPHSWFQEASGTHALINHSDARLGVEKVTSSEAELVLGGFIRSFGPVAPIYLAREYDAVGKPQGYRGVLGVGFLSDKDREVYQGLPEQFRYTDVKRALGDSSDSNTKRLLQKFESLEIAKPDGKRWVKKRERGDGGEGRADPLQNGAALLQ
jgi:hypothetical protein